MQGCLREQRASNGKQTAFIQRFSHQWPLKVLYNIASHSPIHTHTDAWRVTASSSRAVMVRRLTQGHLHTQLGGAGDRTSNLPVTSQPALPPELLSNIWIDFSKYD